MASNHASEYLSPLDSTPPSGVETADAGSCRERPGWFSKQFWLTPQACSPMILPPAKHGALLGMTARLFRPKS
jgi:hypothetical protein